MLTSLADYAAVALDNASLFLQAQQEITDRKKIAESLRESEERYALAVRGANDGLWDWNLRTGHVYYSPRWKAMLGFTEEEVGASPNEWFSRIHPDDFERVKLDISSHYQRLTTHFESEHRMKDEDGDYKWMNSRGIAVWDEDGVAQRLVGSLTDIHDRKMAEQKLLHDAFHDTLTNLPNRALFLDRLRYAV
jgi:PAS domain S-box-containing protein